MEVLQLSYPTQDTKKYSRLFEQLPVEVEYWNPVDTDIVELELSATCVNTRVQGYCSLLITRKDGNITSLFFVLDSLPYEVQYDLTKKMADFILGNSLQATLILDMRNDVIPGDASQVVLSTKKYPYSTYPDYMIFPTSDTESTVGTAKRSYGSLEEALLAP